MIVHDLGKSALLGLVVVGLVILVAVGRATLDDVMPIFTMVVGYLVGNGVNAIRKNAPSPVLVAKLPDVDHEPSEGP